MKNTWFYLFLFSFLQINLYAQDWHIEWIPHAHDLIPNHYQIRFLEAVDGNTVWALACPHSFENGLGQGLPKLLHTGDGGWNWSVLDLPTINSGEIRDVSATSDSIVWISTTNYQNGNRILLSKDGGTSFEEVGDIDISNCGSYQIEFANDSLGYLMNAECGNFYTTFDGGQNWIQQANFPIISTPERSFSKIFVQDNKLWFATNWHLYHSSDYGQQWQTLDWSNWGQSAVTSMAFHPNGHGMAISSIGNSMEELFLTTKIQTSFDDGANWNVEDTLGFRLMQIATIPGLDNAYIGVSGVLMDTFLGTIPSGSAYTLDGGQNWIIIDNIPYSTVEFVSHEVGWSGRIGNFDYEGNPALFKARLVLTDVKNTPETSPALRLFPNPVTDFLNIQLPELEHQPMTISIFDVNGKTVQFQSLLSGQSVDVKKLTSGLYGVDVRVKGKVYSGRFIK